MARGPLDPGVTRRAIRLAAAWALLLSAAAPAAAGTFGDLDFPSPALGAPQSARVYVPDGVAPAGGWPVLYLLHGLDGTARDWEEEGDLGPTLDRLIGGGEIRPVLVVMPYGANSWYVDSAAVGGPGDYQSAILRDLPAAVEARYPVGRDAAHRAIAGLSMGGSGALRLAFLAPERFGAVAALSPAIWQNVPPEEFGLSAEALALIRDSRYFHRTDADTVEIGIDQPPEGRHFGGAFGTPFQPLRFNAATVFTLIADAIARDVAMPPTYVTVGDDDSHLLWRGAIALFETMRADERPIEFRMTDGDHSWDLWRVSIADALRFLDAHLGDAKTTGLPPPAAGPAPTVPQPN